MSIASKLSVIQSDVADIREAIADKGVTVPSGSGTSDFAGLIARIEAGYSILETAYYSKATLTVTLPAKPKLVIVTPRSGNIAANGIFAYASLDPDTGDYVALIQTRTSGNTVQWVDQREYVVWDEGAKTFSMRVRTGTSTSGTCTYHAVG